MTDTRGSTNDSRACSGKISMPQTADEKKAGCCGSARPRTGETPEKAFWVDGVVRTDIGDVPRVPTALSIRDRLGSVKARLGIGRMNYRVTPGLYAAGSPSARSPVAVSANYKLSFDRLRAALAGRDAWILVLDTDGINVWCAAGKGTFGTDEIVRRAQSVALDRIVSHRTLVVPQLGGPGVSAHEVRRRSGFRVVYGPVRAEDLPAFLDARMKAEPEMRRVRFALRDRAVLIPVEMVAGAKYAFIAAAIILLLSGLNRGGYSIASVRANGLVGATLILGAFFGSASLGPLLLPWLPGRAFAVKGAALGLLLSVALLVGHGSPDSWLRATAWAVTVPTITSFILMNFTGASTYTSLSGVKREMRFAVPAQIAGAVIGLGLWVASLFVSGGQVT